MSQPNDEKFLRDLSPHLRDDGEFARRILDVVERDSVIEHLPPFSPEFREKLRKDILDELKNKNGSS